MKRLLIVSILAVLTFAVGGCNKGKISNPLEPSNVYLEPSNVYPDPSNSNFPGQDESLYEWSPYVVVHTPGDALSAYQVAIPELMATGALRGVRVGIIKGEGRNIVNYWLASTGLDVLWIFDNYFLFEPDIEAAVDQAMALYPGIRYLQIGNEATTIIPRNEPQISIEMYMNVLKRIYNHVQARYSNTILVTQSTFGSGDHGSSELERMIELGLREMSPSKLIVGMNVYSLSTASNYSHVINNSLRGYRIWITETGTTNPDEHIRYVRDVYPVLRNNLRAERIYWYCLYCGDSGPDVGFGLIKNLQGQSFWSSPLYNLLAGRR